MTGKTPSGADGAEESGKRARRAAERMMRLQRQNLEAEAQRRDQEYLDRNVMPALFLALQRILELKPDRPLEALADIIRHYQDHPPILPITMTPLETPTALMTLEPPAILSSSADSPLPPTVNVGYGPMKPSKGNARDLS